MKVCVGGTFNVFHKGHEGLIDYACLLAGKDELIIGVTSDSFARVGRGKVRAFDERVKDVENYVRGKGVKYRIVEINDPYGPSLSYDVEGIVVSTETYERALEINKIRRERGMKELSIFKVGLVLAEDGFPISSRRILAGEIDRSGRCCRRLVIAVGSRNPVKIRAVERVFSRVLSSSFDVKSVEVDSGVPPQPFGDQTVKGAIERARRAMSALDADYGVGIEAGLFFNKALNRHLDVQFCAIVDRTGRVTVGHGPGFYYPPAVEGRVRGDLSVGDVMEMIYGLKDLGKKSGAVGFLSKGLMDRTTLTEAAIIMALIPRLSSELYEVDEHDCQESEKG